MDPWTAFDELRASWEVDSDANRAHRAQARHDLASHALTFVMVNAAVWISCLSAGTSLWAAAGLTGLWGLALALHLERTPWRPLSPTIRPLRRRSSVG